MTTEQARAAFRIGVQRNTAANRLGRRHRFGYRPTPIEERRNHGMSAVSEQWVALETHRRWIADGFFDEREKDKGDVDGLIAVRWTTYLDGCLIVHPDDPIAFRAVLVVGPVWPNMRIAGWIPIAEARRAEWWRTEHRHPAYFVPQIALFPIEELKLEAYEVSR